MAHQIEAAKKGAAKWKAKREADKKQAKKSISALQKHTQTKNVKRLMTTGGAYKKRTPIKVVSESTPKKGTGKLGPSGQSGYKFYNKGGRAGFQGGGRTNLLEELGRVEAEPSNRNRRAEISRVHGELNRGYKKGGRTGLKHGGSAGAVMSGKKVGAQIK